jgi:tetratricopeptide (TPR) repeat protein
MREDAEAYLISALRLTERVGDRFAAADVLNNLGELARTSGDLAAARARFEQALALARDIRSPLRQATALEGLGLCDADEERDLEAQTNLREALGIHTKLGSPHVSRVAAILEDHSW